MIQGALFLLLALVVLGIFGRWRQPKVPKKPRGPLVQSAERCRVCGDYVLGRADSCTRADCPHH